MNTNQDYLDYIDYCKEGRRDQQDHPYAQQQDHESQQQLLTKESKMSDQKKPRLITPVGFAKWAHVQIPKPPYEGKGEAKYQIDVCFTAEDEAWKKFASELMAQVKALPSQTDKHTGEILKKQMPIKKELDSDEKPTGRFYVTFKTGEKFKPPVFDKFGKPIEEMVGNESKVKVAYTTNEYTAFGGGINLYLNAVQVLDLVAYKQQSAEGYGFGVEMQTEAAADPFSDFESDIPF